MEYKLRYFCRSGEQIVERASPIYAKSEVELLELAQRRWNLLCICHKDDLDALRYVELVPVVTSIPWRPVDEL